MIGNGVDPALFDQPQQAGRDVVYIGRLEFGGKGLDLLLDAWKPDPRAGRGQLVIAGEGHDEARVRREVERLGLDDRVRFVGWVRGEEKARLLAGARAVAMPSRMETFGIVAVEALRGRHAGGRLRRSRRCARSSPRAPASPSQPFDVEAYAQRLAAAVHRRRARALAMGVEGRKFAAGYDWDALAARQAEVYRAAGGGGGGADDGALAHGRFRRAWRACCTTARPPCSSPRTSTTRCCRARR